MMVKFLVIMFISIIAMINLTGCRDIQTYSQSQISLPEAGAKPTGSQGPFIGFITTDSELLLGSGNSIEEKVNQTSLGKLYLVYSKKNDFKTEVPSEAMSKLNLYLRTRLKWCRLGQPPDIETGLRWDMDLVRSSVNTKNELMDFEIDTPDGRRKISYEEAGNLIEYVGISADDLCTSLGEEF